ncbi:MAG: SurA N-terminal domain-containing protein, partial [Candidatus Puniceispirillales bacterium]
MLKSMREGAKSTPMQIFLVILAVGFALWGIGDVFRTVASNDSAIKVGTVEVSAIEAAREFDRTRRTYLPTSNNSEAIAS